MLPLDLIERDRERVQQRLGTKGVTVDLEPIVRLAAERRRQGGELERLMADKRRLAAAARGTGAQPAPEPQAEGRRVREQIADARRARRETDDRLTAAMLEVPNLPAQGVPMGRGREEDRCVATYGERPAFDFAPVPHADLLAGLGLADLDAGANAAAGGFVALTGAGARLERAMAALMLDTHRGELSAVEVSPPLLVNRRAIVGSGHAQAAPEGMYETHGGLVLSPAGEAGLLGMHGGRAFPPEQLPLTFVSHTPCFRRAIGSAGSSTRGLLRLHQFSKVELVRFADPDDETDPLVPLLRSAERVLQALGLHYRVMELCAGRLSFASARAFEIDAWAPASQQWLTVGACRDYGDFQARRLQITARRQPNGTAFVRTASATAAAIPRTLVALLETHQQHDAAVRLPPELRPHMQGQHRLSP